MARRTLHLPNSVEALVRELSEEGESFSAAACRLILEGASRQRGKKPPPSVASGKGRRDLSRKAELYLRKPVTMK